MRGKLLDEKLAAMKELWANDKAEFHGHYVDFDATYCWPKPVQKPHPKIYFGGFTTATVSRARRHHAGWMPMGVPVADMVPEQLSLIDGATDIPVSIIAPEKVELAVLDAYRQHGAERAFILLSTKPESESLQLLDSIAAFTEIYG
jgi:Luciferase-like monooxygenase